MCDAEGSKFTNEMRGKIWSQKIIVRTCGNFEKPHFKRVAPGFKIDRRQNGKYKKSMNTISK